MIKYYLLSSPAVARSVTIWVVDCVEGWVCSLEIVGGEMKYRSLDIDIGAGSTLTKIVVFVSDLETKHKVLNTFK